MRKTLGLAALVLCAACSCSSTGSKFVAADGGNETSVLPDGAPCGGPGMSCCEAIPACANGSLCRADNTCSPTGGTIKLGVQSIDKVDLLLMVDNSASMADKFSELGRRMPELIKALADPDIDPVTMRPKTQRVADLHVGIITSSLGSHGTSACDGATYPHADDHGHLMPRAGENGTSGYTVDSVGGPPAAAACPVPVAASALTWAFDPAKGAQNSGQAGVKAMEASVACIVQSAKEDGCGYEAQLESVYHFLIDPAPYLTADVVPACTKSAAGDSCGTGKITPSGLDQTLLDERRAFLRPDSLLAVIMLTDENDGSILPAGLDWIPLAYSKGTMLRGWKGCENVPDDFEPQTSADYATLWGTYRCLSCLQKAPDGSTDPNCAVPWASTPLDNDVDGANERMLQQTRRYGYNFLWGRQRYVDGFSAAMVPGSDGKLAPNPLFAGGVRTKDRILVAGILGVPSKLLPTNADGTSRDLTESDWDKIVSPDLSKRDPHMIEQIAPRTANGVALYAGDRAIDDVNGGDRHIADGNDLQYACIAPRDPSVQNLPMSTGDCAAAGSASKSPLCGPDVSGKGTQPYFKAYPTLRQLRVIHELQNAKVPAFVASLCTNSYSPAIQGILAKLQGALSSQCLKSVLDVDPSTGAVTCTLVESFAVDKPRGAASCEALSTGKLGYCTPGKAPCRFATDAAGKASSSPPVSPAEAAARLQLQITVIDPTTGAAVTQTVTPAADPDGNVYATGLDGRKHLVCEMLQLAGNPTVSAAEQSACLHDPAFNLADGSGGWCYSTDDTIVGAKCKAAGALGSLRFLGTLQPSSGSEVFAACLH
jgi:hypothetical protein